jgi:tRNA threonylcarbamoyl adenosine modification protein (Sua5/YciO/YrdC/YwlC family)
MDAVTEASSAGQSRPAGADRVRDCTDPQTREPALEDAAAAIADARLVVLPTDTVYGVAADAFDHAAVRRLLRAKGRGRDMPVPVLVGAAGTLVARASSVPTYARDMVTELWPGPLTLICTQQPTLSWDLGDARSTVAVRMPDHEVAVALLARTGPLAVSSANRTGMAPATTVAQAVSMLATRVALYLDAGPSPSDVPSTILDVTGPRGRVLRQGAIPLERLREFDSRIAAADDA